MGREIKRVPVDWDWPLNKIWEGYLMPSSMESAPCPAGDTCFSGHTAAAAWVEQIAHLALMLDDVGWCERISAGRGLVSARCWQLIARWTYRPRWAPPWRRTRKD